MASDTRLKLVAELRDLASPRLRQLGKELKEIRTTPGMTEASKFFKNFSEQASGFVKDGGGITAAMGAIGLGGLTAAASLSELVRSMRELGSTQVASKETAREIGMSLDALNQFKYAASQLRVDPDKAVAGLETLSSQLLDTQRGVGTLATDLKSIGRSDLAVKISHESMSDAVKDIGDFLATMNNQPQLQKAWAGIFFGDGSTFAQMFNTPGMYEKYLAEAKKNVAPITKEFLDQEAALHSSIVEFEQAWTNFEVKIGPAVFGGLKTAADDMRASFDDIKGVYDWFQANKDKTTKQFIDDNAKAGNQTFHDALKEKEAFNAKERAAGRGPLFDAPHAILGTERALSGETPSSSGPGGGAFDVPRLVAPGGPQRGGSFFKPTAFETGFGGDDNALTEGVKSGVLSAFREMMQGGTGTSGGSGGGGGFQNASYTTGGSGDRYGLAGLGGGRRGGASGDDGPLSDSDRAGKPGKMSGSLMSRGKTAMGQLLALGATKEAAAVILGNAEQESGINGHGPLGDTKRFGFGDNAAHGMFQWRGDRFRALARFAAARGKPWQDEATELAFMVDEAKHRKGGAAWLQGHDVNAANLGMKRFEGYGDNSFGTRLANAKRWLGVTPDATATAPNRPSLAAEAAAAAKAHADLGATRMSYDAEKDGLTAHLHIHEGKLKGVSTSTTGRVKPVVLHRAPTMTQA